MNAVFYKKGLSTMSFEFDLTITGIDTLLYNEQRKSLSYLIIMITRS